MVKSMIASIKNGPVIHPFLLAVYPLLFLWGGNRVELSRYASTEDFLLPMAISAGITLLLLMVSGLLLRNWRLAGLFVAFTLLLFYSYGHVQTAIADSGQFGFPKHQYLVVICVGVQR